EARAETAEPVGRDLLLHADLIKLARLAIAQGVGARLLVGDAAGESEPRAVSFAQRRERAVRTAAAHHAVEEAKPRHHRAGLLAQVRLRRKLIEGRRISGSAREISEVPHRGRQTG